LKNQVLVHNYLVIPFHIFSLQRHGMCLSVAPVLHSYQLQVHSQCGWPIAGDINTVKNTWQNYIFGLFRLFKYSLVPNTSVWPNNSASTCDLGKLIIVPGENVPNKKCAYSEVLDLRRTKWTKIWSKIPILVFIVL